MGHTTYIRMSEKKTRREWMKHLAMAGGVILLGAVGYKRKDAEELLRRGKDRFSDLFARGKEAVNPDKEVFYDDEPIPNEAEYLSFLAGLGLRYISPREIVRPHKNYRKGVRNNIPPKSLWENIGPTLVLADTLRNELGVKVTLLSVYRSRAYNNAVGGASRSQHMLNKAVDLMFDCPADEAFAAAKRLRREGAFKGGIGWYPSFIHVDTRGHDATWGKEV